MGATVAKIYGMLDALAPFDTAMAGDNVGLLIGRMDARVDTVLCALDATPAVLSEAKALGAQLLVTHHPLMFSPVQRLDESDPEAAVICGIIRAGLSLIAAHTNVDLAPGGINDALCEALGWPASRADGFLRLGTLHPKRRLGDLQAEVSAALHWPVQRYGPADRVISRFAVCGGAGGGEAARAAALGAEVLLTGEIKHDRALDAVARGIGVLAAGHRATEVFGVKLLRGHLQSALDAVELRVQVFASSMDPFV